MPIQMRTHEHLTLYRICQSAVEIHQATTKQREYLTELKEAKIK
jgi:hypothetical protein